MKTTRIKMNKGTRELVGLCVGVMLYFTLNSMLNPLSPQLISELGAEEWLVGLILGLSVFGALVLAVPAGIIVGKIGTKRPLWIGAALAAVCCLLIASFKTIPMVMIGLFVYRLADLFIIIGAQAHVATLGPDRDSNQDFGWYGVAMAIGQLIGPVLGGFVKDAFSMEQAWLGMGVIGIGNAIAFMVLIGPGHATPEGGDKRKWDLPRIRGLMNMNTMVVILAIFVVIFADGSRTNFFPLYMKGLGYSATMIGVVLSVRAVASIATRAVLGPFVKLVGSRYRALAVSMAAMAVGICTTPFFTDLAGLMLNTVFIGIGIGIALPLSMAAVADGVPADDRGAATGLRITGNRLAQTTNPVFFGFTIEFFGMSAAFFTGGAILIVMILPLVFWRMSERKKRHMEAVVDLRPEAAESE